MNALSRREEETLLKATKERALKECDDVVQGKLTSGIDEVSGSCSGLLSFRRVR